MSNSNGAFETAVAAAAYAITTLEQQGSMDTQKRIKTEEQRGPLAKAKSRREDSMRKPSESKLSRWLSRKGTKEDAKPSGSSSTAEEPSTLGKKLHDKSDGDRKLPGKQTEPTVTMKKTPTFSDKYLNDTGDARDQRGQTMQRAPSALKPRAPAASGKGNGARNANDFPQENAWARAKMADVQRRYEKWLTEILEWENRKKDKARRRKDGKERELERRRAIALNEYHVELSRIDKVAGGERALVEQQRRNEEAKVREKAKKKRSDGGTRNSCFCCQ